MSDIHNPDNIKNCPHCGSEEGYMYTYVDGHSQWTGFDGIGKWNDVGKTHSETKKRCVECKKIIKELK